MALVTDKKAGLKKWTGLFLFDITLQDGTPRYWAKQAVTFNGNSYSALVLDHSPMRIEAGGMYGVDSIVEIALALNNADANLNAICAASNIRGGTVQPRFIYIDPDTGTTTTDAVVYPVFLFDLLSDLWPVVKVTAHNKYSFHRKTLPASRITRKDRYPFPSTAAERLAGYSDPTSEFYALGYSPDDGQGEYKDVGPPAVYYTAADYNGTRDADGSDGTVCLDTIGLSARGGHFGKVPATVMTYAKRTGHVEFKGSANEAKYGQAVPLVYGHCRVTPVVLDTGGPSDWNGARLSHLLLSDGVNFGAAKTDYGCQLYESADTRDQELRCWVKTTNGRMYLVPRTSASQDVTGSYAVYGGYLGSQVPNQDAYRNITPATDLPGDDFQGRDLYSGLCFMALGLPKEIAFQDSATGPEVEVLFKGLRVETWNDAGTVHTWAYSNNPVWIMVDMLKRLRWSVTQMDEDAIYHAADYCNTVLANGKKRFRCNLALTQPMKAADVLRGVRNCCRMYTTYGNDGKLQLRIKKNYSDTNIEFGGVFAIDSTVIVRDGEGRPQVRKFHKSAHETANVFRVDFQNEDHDFVMDSLTKIKTDIVADMDEKVESDSQSAIMGLPSYDQAERVLAWYAYEACELNEYYHVVCTQAAIQWQVGMVGTITETRLGLSSQQARIIAMASGPGDTVELLLQKHADAAYGDDTTTTPYTLARSDSSYSPRSVGGVSGATGNPTVTEIFAQDDQNYNQLYRKILVEFTPPPTAYSDPPYSRRTEITGGVTVATTGGTITGNQVLFVEVCPRAGGVDGLPCEYLLVNIPAGTNTNKFTLNDVLLPTEATHYTVRVGQYPGRLFKHTTAASPGSAPFDVEITSIASLDSSSLSPDPLFDHVRVFYYYDDTPEELHDAGRTFAVDCASLEFQPEAPSADATEMTVIVSSSNAEETDFFPLSAAPSTTISLTRDTGNPSGCSLLEILTNEDEPDRIQAGYMVFQWMRDYANYQSIFAVQVTLDENEVHQGPYKEQRDLYPDRTHESGASVAIQAMSQRVDVATGGPDRTGKVFHIYTGDEDDGLDGRIISEWHEDYIVLSSPFFKSGTFKWVIIDRWFDAGTDESDNAWSRTFWVLRDLENLSVEDTIWRTKPIPIVPGTWYANAITLNKYGVSVG